MLKNVQDRAVHEHNGPFFMGSILRLHADRSRSEEYSMLKVQIGGETVTSIRGDGFLNHTGPSQIGGTLYVGAGDINSAEVGGDIAGSINSNVSDMEKYL